MKSKELMVYNLPTNQVMRFEIDAKPNRLFFAFIIISVVSMLIFHVNYYNVAAIIVSLCVISFMPKIVLMEFYNDYLVMYNKADKNKCEIIYYEDVVSWNYSWNAYKDYLIIDLVDGKSERIEAFSKTIFEHYMNIVLKDKHKKTK